MLPTGLMFSYVLGELLSKMLELNLKTGEFMNRHKTSSFPWCM